MHSSDTARVLALLKRHGWNSTSFQVLGPGFRYWFHGADACIAYVEVGRAWVVAGAPIAPAERFAALAAEFLEQARSAGRRVCCFATETRFRELVGWPALRIGEQPSWEPGRWSATLECRPTLRAQLRRARSKGVVVRQLDPAELSAPDHPTRRQVEGLIERWLAQRKLAPMGFLVQLDPFSFPEERLSFVAERAGRVLGFLGVAPVYARRGWFVEDFLRDSEAPNGTVELLIDAALRAAAAAEVPYLTLGLAPLAGELPRWLRLARSCSGALYDFEGLRRFKAKLGPARWDPIFLSYPPSGAGSVALLDALTAFAHGRPLRFGAQTLRRRLAPRVPTSPAPRP